MKNRVLNRILAASLAVAMAASLSACGGQKKQVEKQEMDVTIDQITLGEDYTDIKADLKFLTHKTDVIDTTFSEYITEFQKVYPNINIEYEGITDYANDITTRLTTGDWGDICMIPTTVDKDELGNYFTKMGDKKALASTYEENMLNNYAYQDSVYGIPSMANVQGIVYNKKVFEDAGVKEVPKTPDSFFGSIRED